MHRPASGMSHPASFQTHFFYVVIIFFVFHFFSYLKVAMYRFQFISFVLVVSSSFSSKLIMRGKKKGFVPC